jgi:hypothetical protein
MRPDNDPLSVRDEDLKERRRKRAKADELARAQVERARLEYDRSLQARLRADFERRRRS